MRDIRRTTMCVAGSVVLALGLCGAAVAIQSGDETKEAAPDLLAGPQVAQEADAPEGREMDRPAVAAAQRVADARGWFMAVRELELNEQQPEQMQAIMAELGAAREAFEKEHGEELRELRQAMQQARRDQQAPPRETMERMRTIQESAPKVDAYQQRVWELLTREQQAALQTRLDEMTKERAERRGERGQRGGPGMGPDDQMPPGGALRPGAARRGDGARRFRRGDFDERGWNRLQFLLEHQHGPQRPQLRRGGEGVTPPPPPGEPGARGERRPRRQRPTDAPPPGEV